MIFHIRQTLLRVSVAASVVLALIASNGIHWHLLQTDDHSATHAHAPMLMVHAHDEAPAAGTHAALTNDESHSHPVASVQLVGLRPPKAPIPVHAPVLEYEAPACVRGSVREAVPLQCSSDSSPPRSDHLITDLPARAPPRI